MAVSFRTVGTWAELTADGSVAIPATPQASDRMYLFARWKDFSVTATVANWTELAEFADGAVGAGNGTGSVKVACWYRDWQSGDTDPTIDFSASPDNASAVIIVMAKEAADVWLTPVAVTAAMTNWTTSSQIVAASSTATVLGGGVVMGLIGIRDDTATMTRPTSGIDDSAAAITWNGNYVEAPATHHSTTTGFDGAADLGYRLVTTGATATLRMTGTISAAETGAALWVVQGVEVNLTVDNSEHDHTAENLALTQAHAITVANASHAQTAANTVLTQVHVLAVQNAAHAQTAESLTFTQVHVLTIQNAAHDHTSEGLTLEVIHHLTVQAASHDHSADGLTLEVTHHLEIQGGSHSHEAGSLTLTQVHELVIADAAHEHTSSSPNVRTIQIVFLDPGGDATQTVGHFNQLISGFGTDVTYDTAQKVVGVGSYRFDSNTNERPAVKVPNVLGNQRRISCYFRYDSVPDVSLVSAPLAEGALEAYSGGGLADPLSLNSDDEVYATATPARNTGQGYVYGLFGFDDPNTGLPLGASIDQVRIIYERKYDVDTSIGISRVKWRIDGVEGPDHDNTDMPLTDTVVEVDVTGDRQWERKDLVDGVFEVIAEARRGDTDTSHTQSWDYLKVEVTYHPANTILALATNGDAQRLRVAVTPRDDGVVLRLIDQTGNTYDGITELAVNTDYRIGLAYDFYDLNLLSANLFVNGIQELSVDNLEAATGQSTLTRLHYGWLVSPGVDHVCWFDQIYIDDGDDLQDPGNMLMTAKLPASTNENGWSTTTGTGAVNERPLSETNRKQHSLTTSARQTYTLQTAATGDVDISGETFIGYLGWAWAKVQFDDFWDLYLVVNGEDIDRTNQISPTASLLRHAVKSTSYPSNAAGIGMAGSNEAPDTFLYECGAVVVYIPQPVNPNSILSYQQLAEDSITNLTDDLRSDPQDSYELCYRIDESEAHVLITVYSIYSEGQEPQLQCIAGGQGGYGRTRITPGIEVQIALEVTGGSTGVAVWRRVNVG